MSERLSKEHKQSLCIHHSALGHDWCVVDSRQSVQCLFKGRCGYTLISYNTRLNGLPSIALSCLQHSWDNQPVIVTAFIFY